MRRTGPSAMLCAMATKKAGSTARKSKEFGVDGARLRKRRESLGLPQIELYALAGIRPDKLSQAENGRKDLNALSVKRLAIALKTSSDYLLGLTDDPNPRK